MIITDGMKRNIAGLAKEHSLDFVVLFGSQANGKTHDKSDVDIAIISHLDINLSKIEMELCEIFKRVDIQVSNLADVSPTLMYAVCRDGVLLYENNPNIYINWKVYATKIWMDTAWLRRLRDKKLLEWSKDYSLSQQGV